MPYLTLEEIAHLQTTTLHRNTPYQLFDCSRSKFILGRQKGYYHHEGYRYTYDAATDCLVRDDVLKYFTQRRKEAEKKKAEECQERLF